jgi:hypothetical protein
MLAVGISNSHLLQAAVAFHGGHRATQRAVQTQHELLVLSDVDGHGTIATAAKTNQTRCVLIRHKQLGAFGLGVGDDELLIGIATQTLAAENRML